MTTGNQEILDFLKRIDEKVDAYGATLRTVADDQGLLRKDFSELKTRVDSIERDLKLDVVRRADLSDATRKHDDEIKAVAAHVENLVRGVTSAVETMQAQTLEAVAAETAKQSKIQNPMLERLSKWHAHPLIKIVGAIIASAVASYFAAKGH